MGYFDVQNNVTLPEWLGNNAFHLSHQSNLLRKNKEYYQQYFGNIESNLPYIWPGNIENNS